MTDNLPAYFSILFYKSARWLVLVLLRGHLHFKKKKKKIFSPSCTFSCYSPIEHMHIF